MVHLHTGVQIFVGFWLTTFPNRWIGWDGSYTLATTIAGYHPPWLLFNGGMLRKKSVFDTSSRYYKFEGKNNRRLCYNNWRHFGENVKRNWLSIRRSPCNKRSTFWSVLTFYKKNFLSWVTFWKINVCIPLSFLVINVCNQGKTLCSLCIYIYIEGFFWGEAGVRVPLNILWI